MRIWATSRGTIRKVIRRVISAWPYCAGCFGQTDQAAMIRCLTRCRLLTEVEKDEYVKNGGSRKPLDYSIDLIGPASGQSGRMPRAVRPACDLHQERIGARVSRRRACRSSCHEAVGAGGRIARSGRAGPGVSRVQTHVRQQRGEVAENTPLGTGPAGGRDFAELAPACRPAPAGISRGVENVSRPFVFA